MEINNVLYKEAIIKTTGLQAGEKDGEWVVNDKKGWRVLSADELTAVDEKYSELYKKSIVPLAITMRQTRLALLNAGKLADVETAIQSATDDIKIEWEYASEILRDSATVTAIGEIIGMTSDEMDALFVFAKDL